jgi:hypothetical protein
MQRASSGALVDSTVWFSFCRAEALEIPLGMPMLDRVANLAG